MYFYISCSFTNKSSFPTVHYNDVIMSAMASQTTSLTIVYSTIYSGADQRKHQIPRHWPLCWEFTGDQWIPRTNGQLRRKCFHWMTSSWWKSQPTFNSVHRLVYSRVNVFELPMKPVRTARLIVQPNFSGLRERAGDVNSHRFSSGEIYLRHYPVCVFLPFDSRVSGLNERFQFRYEISREF